MVRDGAKQSIRGIQENEPILMKISELHELLEMNKELKKEVQRLVEVLNSRKDAKELIRAWEK